MYNHSHPFLSFCLFVLEPFYGTALTRAGGGGEEYMLDLSLFYVIHVLVWLVLHLTTLLFLLFLIML